MRRRLEPPRLLPDILQAILELKDRGGSNIKNITTHVRYCSNIKNPRNLGLQVGRALQHAVESGVIRQRLGRYQLNTRKKHVDPPKGCADCRRRKRLENRRKKNRRGYKRRRSEGSTSATSESHYSHGTDSESTKSKSKSPEKPPPTKKAPSEKQIPVVEARKKNRRQPRRSRRRSRRRNLRSYNDGEENERDLEDSNQENSDDLEPEPLNDQNKCGNPDCLCEVKQEMKDAHD